MRCEVCGGPIRSDNRYGVCQMAACLPERDRRRHALNLRYRQKKREWATANRPKMRAAQKRWKQSHG